MTHALPPPSGSFAVGRAPREWTDAQRTDPYATDPAEPRSLVVWVWYPTDRAPEAVDGDYLPSGWRAAGDMLGIRTEGLKARSSDGGPVAGARASYPVVLLSPSGFPPLMLSAVAEDLASHGFVVLGVNHTYEPAVTVFADGRTAAMNPAAIAGALGAQGGSYQEVFARRGDVCRYKAADLAFIADRLADLDSGDPLASRLDLSRLSAIGHSFGGAAALQWCRDDPRCFAAANLDGALWTEVADTGLARPVLQLLAPHREFDVTPDEAVQAGMAPDPEWFATEKALTFGGWETVDRTGRPAHSFQITGATHLSFMDVPFLPVGDDSPVQALLAATTVDPARMREIMTTLLVDFLATGDVSAATAESVSKDTAPLTSSR